MAAHPILTLDGDRASIAQPELDALAAAFRGELLTPDSPGYDAARTIWNGMIDRRPALIARCAGASDVMRAVRLAREHGLLTAVRGGGHNIAGNAVCDGGLMIDLSQMMSVRVDPGAKRVHVEPGALLSDLDRETQEFGLAVPVGINSTTGVAGLTLGGGFGWLSRKHGLTVDSLVAADVVTADGELRRASATENADLFWAIRGGGGNFGVVTRFEFEVHEVGPEVFAGLVVFPARDAKQVLAQYRDWLAGAPEDLSVWVVMRKAPPLPFLPDAVHGTDVVVLALCHLGDPEAAAADVDAIRGFGAPVGEHVGAMPFAAWQAAFDPLLAPGARNYWKSHNFAALTDDALDVLVAHAGALPGPECEVFLAQLGGAVNRVPSDATAYAHRSAKVVMNVHARWQDPADDGACIAWARSLFEAATPHAMGGVYVNFMTEEEAPRVAEAYGPVYDRLVAAKRRYDPDNLFRLNQNIRP